MFGKAVTRKVSAKPSETKKRLTHWNGRGEVRMVDVGEKTATARTATASASVRVGAATAARIAAGSVPKGDVFATARLAGISAAKRTDELIPLCHRLALTGIDLELTLDRRRGIVRVVATARAFDRTGVEMEALVAATVASLTIYDMLKGIDRGITITDVGVVEKSGGRSGAWRRVEP
jgi:cyclic pyranopterin phosphate synthase